MTRRDFCVSSILLSPYSLSPLFLSPYFLSPPGISVAMGTELSRIFGELFLEAVSGASQGFPNSALFSETLLIIFSKPIGNWRLLLQVCGDLHKVQEVL